jgi:fructose-bisphosphate aldolase class I
MPPASAIRDQVMMARIRAGAGFIAALDQSGGSTAAALRAYGVPEGGWSGDEEMFALMHRMRERVMRAPSFDGRRVLGAILFERTMDGTADGRPVPDHLRRRGVASFLKVDRGLQPEADGVRLMKPIDGLDALLDRARSRRVLGTKMRSVVGRATPAGMSAVVGQQFELAERIAEAGLLPILEPEVLLATPDRAVTERQLAAEITKHLDAMDGDRQVVLKLTISEEPDTYANLVGHHRVARVLALSGGLTRAEACNRLARNRGVIASFSRALLQGLDSGMDDAVFDRSLNTAIEQIYTASTVKRPA